MTNGKTFDVAAIHQQIMNLPGRVPDAVFSHDRNNGASAYQRGFSDARHAAAELVAALPEQLPGTPEQPVPASEAQPNGLQQESNHGR